MSKACVDYYNYCTHYRGTAPPSVHVDTLQHYLINYSKFSFTFDLISEFIKSEVLWNSKSSDLSEKVSNHSFCSVQ